ncbi:MAG: hypothetical protein AB7I57_24880 [Pirellulales bacterium]
MSALTREASTISATELAVLLAFGALAAVAVSMLHISFRVPGHAILRAVFPMAAGLALVPRRSAGLVMATGALAATGLMRLGNFGEIQSAAFVSLLALGPLLDLALAGAPVGWKLYARFAAAGAGANLLAFASRFALAMFFRRGGGGMGNGMGGGMGNGTGGGFGQLAGGHDFLSFWPLALVSFTLCGAIAGLVSAAVWFRLRASESQ